MVKKVIVYNDRIKIYILPVEDLNIKEVTNEEVVIKDEVSTKLLAGRGCLILECQLL